MSVAMERTPSLQHSPVSPPVRPRRTTSSISLLPLHLANLSAQKLTAEFNRQDGRDVVSFRKVVLVQNFMGVLREEWMRMEEQRMRALAAVTARTQERVDRWSRELAPVEEHDSNEAVPMCIDEEQDTKPAIPPRPPVKRRSASLKPPSPTSDITEFVLPLVPTSSVSPAAKPDLEMGFVSDDSSSESDDDSDISFTSVSSCDDGKVSDADSGVDMEDYQGAPVNIYSEKDPRWGYQQSYEKHQQPLGHAVMIEGVLVPSVPDTLNNAFDIEWSISL
ncbi:hypothetical protein HDV00_009546 [Rhizophlyctis rosea]|nr:hypothetical protein HDV00_009546 [Rhizophlyctis rosea]